MSICSKIWIDGRVAQLDSTQSPLFHQGLNYGACVYEGIRFYETVDGPALFRLDDHLQRFFYSADTLRMHIPYTQSDLARAIEQTIQENGLKRGYVRPLAFFAEPKMGINIEQVAVSLVILCWDWDETVEAPPATLCVVTQRHLAPEQVDLKAKIGGYYAVGLLGFIEARSAGYELPLLLDMRGYVSESAISNIFFVKQGTLFTPKPGHLLPGITRDTVIALARETGVGVVEKDILPSEIGQFEAAFLTGTGIGVRPIAAIDGHVFDSAHATTKRLQQRLYSVTHGQKKAAHAQWREYIRSTTR